MVEMNDDAFLLREKPGRQRRWARVVGEMRPDVGEATVQLSLILGVLENLSSVGEVERTWRRARSEGGRWPTREVNVEGR